MKFMNQNFLIACSCWHSFNLSLNDQILCVEGYGGGGGILFEMYNFIY